MLFASVDAAASGHETRYAGRVHLRYSFRIYPTPGQQQSLARAFGCARVVFNDALRTRQQAHAAGLPSLTDAELSARLTAAKATPERAWLGDVSAVVLQQALADLTAAYRNFFASLTGRRNGPKIAPPTFRSRKDRRRRSGLPPTPGSGCCPAGSCGCPRSGTYPYAGRGACRPNRRA